MRGGVETGAQTDAGRSAALVGSDRRSWQLCRDCWLYYWGEDIHFRHERRSDLKVEDSKVCGKSQQVDAKEFRAECAQFPGMDCGEVTEVDKLLVVALLGQYPCFGVAVVDLKHLLVRLGPMLGWHDAAFEVSE